MRKLALGLLLLMYIGAIAWAQEPGWPRQKMLNGAKMVYYLPQVDDWKDFRQLDARMAISLTPAGGKPVVGVVAFSAQTSSDVNSNNVVISNFKITNTYFPSLNAQQAASMDALARSFLPPNASVTTAVSRLIASANKKKPATTVTVKNEAPNIYVSYRPAILLMVPGDPLQSEVKDTKVDFVMNSNWPVFFDKKSSQYYLFNGKGWQSAPGFNGPWVFVTKLPKDMDKVGNSPQWADLKPYIPPPPSSTSQIPQVFYSNNQAEIVVFAGRPVYSPIPGTQLTYASNTESPVFVYSPTQAYYYLTAGRWFTSPSLLGPWTYATDTLPHDFQLIPASSPAARILTSVPGTPQAEDAVLMAQVPTVVQVNAAQAAEKVNVLYDGPPQFKPIEGTTLSYAVNTGDRVIQVGSLYYLCFQGIWFMSSTPQGPWQTATTVPPEIYNIPPSSPVYNVTYVTQTVIPDGYVQASYTAGYLGAFVVGAGVGAIIASGTGYWYPPYVGWYGGYPHYYPYPYTYGYHYAYNPYTGAYGYGRSAYGPYGGVSYGAGYNPATGTYARGASVSTPYGTQRYGQAYNPYTGAYGATHQGSNAYSSWGSSVYSKNGQSAYSQHYSNANGSVGSVHTSTGGTAVAGAGKNNEAFAGKSSSGDMYAGADGNVYKNTGSGWQKYDNGSWNNVNKPSSSDPAPKAPSSSGDSYSSLNQEAQNRARGDSNTQSWQNAQHSWGSGSSSDKSWGGGDKSWGGGDRSWGGDGRSWGGGGRSFGGGGFRR